MNYSKIYNQLIANRKLNVHSDDIFTEKHHIIPKSHGGSDSIDNIVALSAREHFIAHWLLWRIHRDKAMAFAFNVMCWNTYGNRYKNSYAFAEARKANRDNLVGRTISTETRDKLSKSMKGRPSPLKGKKASDATKEKLRVKAKVTGLMHIGNTYVLGRKHTEDAKAKMSSKAKGRIVSEETKAKIKESKRGIVHSVETKLKMSESAKCTVRLKVVCPHCLKEGDNNLMKRYHFDNCKLNTQGA